MKPLRPIGMAELMASANNFTRGYADALLTVTLKEDLAIPDEPKKAKGMAPEEIARMEHEKAKVSRFLATRHSNHFAQFQKLVAAENLQSPRLVALTRVEIQVLEDWNLGFRWSLHAAHRVSKHASLTALRNLRTLSEHEA